MKILYLAAILLLLNISTLAQSKLESVSDKVHNSGKVQSQTNENYKNNESKSGYVRDVHILDRQYLFYKRKFSPRQFSKWLDIYAEVKAIEWVLKHVEDNTIGQYGQFKTNIMLFNKRFTNGSFLKLDTVIKLYQNNVSSSELIQYLIDSNILSEEKYLLGFDESKTEIGLRDFDYLLPAVKTLPYNLENDYVMDILNRELVILIGSLSQEILVTQEETTRYESRKDNLLENIFDSAVGNAVGNMLFKDKVKRTRHTLSWDPQINIFENYPSLYAGFSPYPYFGNNSAPIALFGNHALNQISYSNSEKDQLKFTNFAYKSHYQAYDSGIDNVVSFGPYLNWASLKENNSALDFAGLGIHMGGTGNVFKGGFGFGLGYFKDLNNTYIGLSTDLEGRYYTPINLSLGGNAHYIFGGKLSQDKGWSYSNVNIDLSLHINRVMVSYGYTWINSRDTSVYHSPFIKGTIFF